MKLSDNIIDTHIDFSFDDNTTIWDASSNGWISISGVQEKFAAIVDHGRLRLAHEGERSTHILKPAPLNHSISDRKLMPANEMLTMQIARLYGITTADCALCTDSKGQYVYATRRFDITNNGKKLAQEDFASILGRQEQVDGPAYKYTGSYDKIAYAIREYTSAWPIAIEQFFRIVVFNYIYANGDAHLKNFSLQKSDGEYTLAPAYDLLNTRLHINDSDFALSDGLSPRLEKSDTYIRTGHPCRIDFERFAQMIELHAKRAAKIMDPFMEIPPEVTDLIAASSLPEKAQRRYRSIVVERTQRFRREYN